MGNKIGDSCKIEKQMIVTKPIKEMSTRQIVQRKNQPDALYSFSIEHNKLKFYLPTNNIFGLAQIGYLRFTKLKEAFLIGELGINYPMQKQCTGMLLFCYVNQNLIVWTH